VRLEPQQRLRLALEELGPTWESMRAINTALSES
jgi:hypothetical protein